MEWDLRFDLYFLSKLKELFLKYILSSCSPLIITAFLIISLFRNKNPPSLLNSYIDLENTISYKYNQDGVRTKKVLNDVKTDYYLDGDSIIFEKTGENVLYYLYNDTSDLLGLNYNGVIYYYIKNYQNDIIGILDSNYNIVAKYEYDSFGNIINITDENNNDISNDLNHIANINLFRYRSYYYDKETKLYYLNNRYYNPLWGRFINADGIINGNKDVLGHNLYAYCSNDFVNKCDSSGNFFGMLALKATALFVGIKALITVASNIYLRNSKKDLSSDMFNKSMYDSKTPISKSIETKIIEKSKNSTPVINAVNTCIAKSNNTNFKDCEPENFEFTSADGDLHYSIQHADIKISGLQQEDNWIITVKMSDTYDFTKFRTDDFFTVSTLANDLGYVMQKTGMLKPYDWDVQYSFIYENN